MLWSQHPPDVVAQLVVGDEQALLARADGRVQPVPVVVGPRGRVVKGALSLWQWVSHIMWLTMSAFCALAYTDFLVFWELQRSLLDPVCVW